MNKQKKVDYKKTLVRNPQKSVPKSQVLIVDSSVQPKDDINKKATAETTERTAEKVTEVKDLDLPELYSTLKLSSRIDRIVEPRKTKSCSDVDKTKLAVDEKVSRKVNFPYDQPVYKDLIPLSCNKIPSQPIITSRGPLPQKDKEPVLLDFIEARKVPQYYYLPNIKIESKLTTISSTNLRLYKMLKINTEEFGECK